MSELKCTRYIEYDDIDIEEAHLQPCHCPVCGGFLKWPDINKPPDCNKCGTELLVIPDKDDETNEELECGKICPISKPKRILEGRET